MGENMGVPTICRRCFCEVTFKLDYFNNEGLPRVLSPFDPIFKRLMTGLKIAGLHKYLHYRSWFRKELAAYLDQALTNASNLRSSFWDSTFVQRLAEEHSRGRKNYAAEINAVLTLEAVERLLIRGSFANETL